MSWTTIAYDQFSDTSGTDLTAHTPSSSITTWVGTAGLFVINSNNQVRTGSALARRDVSIYDCVPGTTYTIAVEVTRPDTLVNGSAGGVILSGNTDTNVNNYKYGLLRFQSVTSSLGTQAESTRITYSWNSYTGGSGVGETRNITETPNDLAQTGTYGWPSSGSKRVGLVYGGGQNSIATFWMENLDGSAYTVSTGTSFATTHYDFPATAGLRAVGLWTDQSGTTDHWVFDNFYVYDGAYYGIGGTPAASLGSFGFSGDTNVTANGNEVFTITAYDNSNLTFSDYTGTITFAYSASSYTGVATYSYTTSDAGVAVISGFVWYVAEQSRLTIASSTSVNILVASAISCVPGDIYSGEYDISDLTLEKGIPTTSVYTLRDIRGNLCTNYAGTVTFRTTDAAATTPGTYQYTAADAGVHTFTDGLTFYSAGTQAVSLQDLAGYVGSRSTDTVFIRDTWNPPPGPSATSYIKQSRTTQVWQQVSELTDAQGYVDFILRVEEQYPMVVSDVNPAYLIESGDTGRP